MVKKVIVPTRTPMAQQDPKVRIHNYEEVPMGYTVEQAIAEAQRCLDCPRPNCMPGCPVNIDIPAFLRLVASGEFIAAAEVVKKTNALPAITGRVCPQESQCEGKCTLAKKFEPVAVGRLERFVADFERNSLEASKAGEKDSVSTPAAPANTGKKVAVVGSGPAGLTVAADLAQLGYQVTIFEALHEAGGVLIYGIPEFRLPKSIVKHEVDYVRSLGVTIQKDFVVGASATLYELQQEYDAIFLGSGAGLPWFLGIPGENLGGVYSSNEYLTRANLMKAYRFPEYDTPIARGDRVLIIGGGNTAMDSARTALRLGAKESIIVYRRSRAELPARLEEVEHAEQEGVDFHLLTTPIAFHGEGGRVKELECLKNELGEPDASGRRRPVAIEGSNFRIPADVMVVAVGQSPSPLISRVTPELAVGKGGIVTVDQATMKTSMKGVFAGGDVITGGATVILAMGQAKIASKAINEYLTTGVW
ncbi:MAG: NADPH-dependent glutamate synthase [Anaerolineaceae bacterium]|nr:NADPH-dependent glutamate synthase [Anaerolineaceae bacterium]